MIRAQIVCKNTTEAKVRKALEKFGLADGLKPLHGHFLAEIPIDSNTDEVLAECRTCAYSYLRLAAWESGGACEATSEAACVAGDEGQPLVPIVERLGESNANKNHALFVSKSGLSVARVVRSGRDLKVSLVTSTLYKHRVQSGVILDLSGEGLTAFSVGALATGHDLDKYMPLLRAVFRKAECVFCTHCHYREIDERSEK